MTETNCKFRFIYVRFECKRKKGVKEWMEKSAMKKNHIFKDFVQLKDRKHSAKVGLDQTPRHWLERGDPQSPIPQTDYPSGQV